MLQKKLYPTSEQRRFYWCALTGFALLSAGYFFREQGSQTAPLAGLLLGVFPNLLGAFATPMILYLLLENTWRSRAKAALPVLFLLMNLVTLAGCLVIEYLHVVFNAGHWDPNDIYASLIGGLVSLFAFTFIKRTGSLKEGST